MSYFDNNVDGPAGFILDIFYGFPAIYGLWIGIVILIWRIFRNSVKGRFIYILFGVLNLHSFLFALTLIAFKFEDIKSLFEGLLLNFLLGTFITIDFLLIDRKTVTQPK